MSYLAWAGPASLPGAGHHAEQARQRLEDALIQLTGSLLEAGLSLETALDLPADALRQAAAARTEPETRLLALSRGKATTPRWT